MPFEQFKNLISAVQGVIVDIGTGDGQFVYRSAGRNPQKFYIGIDPNTKPLENISERIHRKPAKGGAPNVLYLRASAENLPAELDGVSNEIHVLFPWGRLLQGMVKGELVILRNLRRICAPAAQLRVIFSLDSAKDESVIKRLALPAVNINYVHSVLASNYRDTGFDLIEARLVTTHEMETIESTWGKRLRAAGDRSVFVLMAQARSSQK